MNAIVSTWRRLPAAMLIAQLILFALPATAQINEPDGYTDRIYLTNGDVITGKIKGMESGRLRLKTRTMDTVFVHWVEIASIDSDKYLRLERNDGRLEYGVIGRTGNDGTLAVKDGSSMAQVGVLDVANIQPIRVRREFWRRIEGDVTAGIDYKKASGLLIANLSSDLRFREQKYELGFSANWNETSRSDDNSNNMSRADVSGSYTRFLGNQWFWKGTTGFERNEELGLDLRTIVGGTAGRYLKRSSTLRFEVNAGLALNWEDRTDGNTETSTEGLIRSSLDIFQLSLPVTRLSANVNVFPGITESGRMRVNTDVTLRNEIIDSLFWDLTFYSTYDSRPPEGASQEDYGVITSLGASF